MEKIRKWKTTVDFGNCAHYICPYCGEEQDWQSKFCPDCGKRVKTDEEIEYEKGTEIRKDAPECICVRHECFYNIAGVCKNPPSPASLYCYNYVENGG